MSMQSEEIGELVSAIGAAMSDVGYVRGTGTNDHHRYNYTSDEDLAAAVQPAMARHGIAMFPTSCQIDRSGDRCTVVQSWRVAHTSGQWMQLEIAGEGVDKQDKGTAKALTGARKYMLRLLFCIPTGDDTEREAAVAQSNARSVDLSPFVCELLDRIEKVQSGGVKGAGPVVTKLIQQGRSGSSDDEIRALFAKTIDWLVAHESKAEPNQ
tara:strand:+ start:78 stop:707 length:630 start_codon:yes stop_codon:yes gene_type:complete